MKLSLVQDNTLSEPEIILHYNSMDEQTKALVEKIQQYTETTTGRVGNRYYRVPLSGIYYIESVDKKTYLYEEHRVLHCGESLKVMQERLEKRNFVRISKNCIVNLAHICDVQSAENHHLLITMENGEHLIASRAYSASLRSFFQTEKFSREDTPCVLPPSPHPDNKLHTVVNLGKIVPVSSSPKRILVTSHGTAELIAALNCADRITAIIAFENYLEDVAAPYQGQLHSIPQILAPDNMPEIESLSDIKSDMLLCNYHFAKAMGMKLLHSASTYAAPVYILESTSPGRATIEGLYRDVQNLGRILSAEAEAASLILRWRNELAELKKLQLRKEPVRVFIFDSTRKNNIQDMSEVCLTSGSESFEHHLVSMAGGHNIFGHVKDNYFYVEWDEVIRYNPQVILIHQYKSDQTTQEKIKWLTDSPESQKIEAVKEGRFLILNLNEVFPGMQNIQAIKKMMIAFHKV
ncbi:MAG: LytTR family transcriptional regulator DNA-binding domain-containing protein [Oscillospiraceae bacterium]|nr:LytTR family transcriptional regulator DNA-binding domain-containing protein [Oscillospiraceae bacterium]